LHSIKNRSCAAISFIIGNIVFFEVSSGMSAYRTDGTGIEILSSGCVRR